MMALSQADPVYNLGVLLDLWLLLGEQVADMNRRNFAWLYITCTHSYTVWGLFIVTQTFVISRLDTETCCSWVCPWRTFRNISWCSSKCHRQYIALVIQHCELKCVSGCNSKCWLPPVRSFMAWDWLSYRTSQILLVYESQLAGAERRVFSVMVPTLWKTIVSVIRLALC